MHMKAPKLMTWIIALLTGLLGILLKVGVVAIIGLPFTLNPFWVVTAAFAILLLGTFLPGL